jgi:formate dehydrogenase subunit gamma
MQASAYSLEETVEAVVQQHAGQLGALLPMLHSLQARMGYIPEDAIPLIAKSMNLSRAEVHGVMHFYHDFRTEPAGDHIVQICRAEACQAMGSKKLESHVKNKLGIGYGETTSDGRYTLEPVYCLGNCACTPSIRVDDDIYARVTPDRFDELLDDLQANRE